MKFIRRPRPEASPDAAALAPMRGPLLAVLLTLALACPAARGADEVDAPAAYDHRYPLATDSADSLLRLRVPLAVLQRLRDDSFARRDLRVFDADGKPLPMAWAGEPPLPEPAWAQAVLSPRPWPSAPDGEPARDVRIEWRGGQGEVLRIAQAGPAGATPSASSTAAAPAAPPRAWLLDLQALGDPRPHALQLDWAPQPARGLELAVRAEASRDAQQWQPAGRAVLVELPAGAIGPRPVLQRQLVLQDLAPEHRYLRLVAERPLPLTGVRAEWPSGRPDADDALLDQARFAIGADGMVDFGTVLLPRRVRFHLAGDTGLAPLVLEREPEFTVSPGPRAALRGERVPVPWLRDASHTAWRLVSGGQLRESPPLTLRGQPVQQWRVRMVGDGAELPQAMTVSWAAPQLVFAASGRPPYLLAVGRDPGRPSALPITTLMPGYEPGAEYKLPTARLADTPPQALPAAPAAARLSAGQRRALLWAMLVAAVAGLGVLAWRLAADMRQAGRAPDPTAGGPSPSTHPTKDDAR